MSSARCWLYGSHHDSFSSFINDGMFVFFRSVNSNGDKCEIVIRYITNSCRRKWACLIRVGNHRQKRNICVSLETRHRSTPSTFPWPRSGLSVHLILGIALIAGNIACTYRGEWLWQCDACMAGGRMHYFTTYACTAFIWPGTCITLQSPLTPKIGFDQVQRKSDE